MPLQFTTTGAVAVTLSNGNKTATSTAASGFGAGAYLNEVVAGKCCFAMRFDGPADGGNIVELVAAPTGLDFANYSISGTFISEFTVAGISNSNGSPSGATLSGAAPIVNGDVIFVCIDEPNNLIWVYKNGTIVSGAGNPTAGTGGLSGYLVSGARIPAVALSSAGAAMTVIDDPVAAGITVPSGFTYLGYSPAPTNPPSNTSVPTLSDTTPVVGQVITTTNGVWTESPTSYAYRWFLDGTVIPGETGSTYTVQAADAGKVLTSGVIATNGIGSSSEAVSADSSPIAHTWQLVGVAVSAVNASGNYTLTLPSGSQSGDVVVAAIAMRSNVGFTVPAGWTQANQDTGGNTTNGTTASDTSSLQAYIIRGGSAPSMVFTRTGGSRALGVVAVYRYTDQSAPPTFDTSVLTPLGAAATAISGTGLTTGAAGELIVGAVFGARNITVSNFRATNPATGSGSTDTTSNPADGAWTERADGLNATSPTVGISLFDAVRTSAGATGSLLATASASALHAIGAMAFAPPATGGPTSTGSLAAVDSGADESSAAGSVAIAGSAAVAETARDTIASAATTAAAGSLAASEGGSDSLVASGTASLAPATGDLFVVDLGADAIVASGGVATAGALAVTDAAADGLVASGSVPAIAAAAVIEVGGDQATLSGAASGAGAVAVQDVGADSLAGSGSAPVAGAIAAADTGSDSAFLFAGKISTGAIVVMDAGSDSASASGAVQVGAAVASIEAGSDAASLLGLLRAAGEAIIVESLGDSASGFGRLEIAGQISVAENDGDEADLVGGVGIRGDLASDEGDPDEVVVLGEVLAAGSIWAVDEGFDAVSAIGNVGESYVVPVPPSRTFRVSPDVRLAVPPLQSRTVHVAPQSRMIIAKG